MELHEKTIYRGPLPQQSLYEAEEHVISPTEEHAARSEKPILFIWYIVAIIDVLLVLRLAFLILGARHIGFADWLYTSTNSLVRPFAGIFPEPTTMEAYFDTAALIGMIVYTLAGWALTALLDILLKPSNR